MHHISKPVELFELIAGVGAELIVIDTRISRAKGSFFEVAPEDSLMIRATRSITSSSSFPPGRR